MSEEVETQSENSEINISCPRKVLFVILLLFGVFDCAADIASVALYWKERDTITHGLGIAIFATVSFILGLPFFIAQLVILIRRWKPELSKWMTNIDGPVNILKFCETTVESIPQLWISLYVLSLTERQPSDGSIILIISATFSYIMIITSAIKFDQIFEELGSSNSGENDFHTKLSSWTLYTSKCIAVVARVFVLVYMTVQVQWWTALFVVIHFLLIFLISCFVSGDIETSRFRHLKLGSVGIIILEAVVSLFCWQVVAKNKVQYHFIFSALFTLENVCGLLLSWFFGIGQAFYLYNNVLAVNLGLDAAALLCAILYVILQTCSPSSERSVSPSTGIANISDSNAANDNSGDAL